jgi:hypothetical protein
MWLKVVEGATAKGAPHWTRPNTEKVVVRLRLRLDNQPALGLKK